MGTLSFILKRVINQTANETHLIGSLLFHSDLLCFRPQAVCLACCPMVHVAAVGTVSGHVYYVDLTFPKKPRVVRAARLYQTPVTHLR